MNPNGEEFQGGVFHDSIQDGRVGARIRVTRGEIIAEPMFGDSSSGHSGERFVIPIREVHLDMGGASGKMIFCRNADKTLTIFSEQRGFATALERESAGLLGDQLKSLKGGLRKENRRFMFWSTVSCAAVVVLCIAGYFGLMAAARAAVHTLPISVDERIGKMAIQSLSLEQKLPGDHAATQLVQKIVERLKPHAKIPEMNFQVMVVDSPEVNAFALPGGQMVVYTGLIKKADSADQLAGVLAHEMSHATLRHSLQQVSQSLGIVAAVQLLVGDVGGLLALGAQVAEQSVMTSYSRGAETEADLEGARMLHAAKINPQAMASFFGKLKDEHGDIPGVLSWISTHPQHADRIESINRFTDSLPKVEYQPLDFDLKAAQAELR
jgi:beta-barrel assembly-enhancing protease